MEQLTKVQQDTLVKACLEDVRYLLSIHCPRFGLDSSEMFDDIKEELEVEFRDNMSSTFHNDR